MEKTALDLTGGWEKIVNHHSREMGKQRQNTYRKWLSLIVAMLAGVLICLLLWMVKAFPSIPAIMVTEICSCVAAFAGGRLWEVSRK